MVMFLIDRLPGQNFRVLITFNEDYIEIGVGSHDGENYFTVTDVNAPAEVMAVPSDAEKSDLVYQDHRWHP